MKNLLIFWALIAGLLYFGWRFCFRAKEDVDAAVRSYEQHPGLLSSWSVRIMRAPSYLLSFRIGGAIAFIIAIALVVLLLVGQIEIYPD